MTENELNGHSGKAYEFSSSLCVVPLEYALAAINAEREACAKMVDHILKEGGGTYGDAMRKRSNVI